MSHVYVGALIALLVGACTANDDVPAPAVASVTPDHASPGTPVTIAGSYFCQQPDTGSDDVDPLACKVTGTVLFGTDQVEAEQYTDTSISVSVPQTSLGAVNVAVTVAGRVSNSVQFTVD